MLFCLSLSRYSGCLIKWKEFFVLLTKCFRELSNQWWQGRISNVQVVEWLSRTVSQMQILIMKTKSRYFFSNHCSDVLWLIRMMSVYFLLWGTIFPAMGRELLPLDGLWELSLPFKQEKVADKRIIGRQQIGLVIGPVCIKINNRHTWLIQLYIVP